MRKKILPIWICMLLITTTVLSEATSVPSEIKSIEINNPTLNSGYTNITIEQAWMLMTDTSNGIQIPIDVRYDNEWAAGHIETPAPENPKHHCVCEMQSNPTILQAFIEQYQGKEIIIYCKDGNKSMTTVNLLIENNFNGVMYIMVGGLDAWIQAGYPTKANSPPNMPEITGENNGNIGTEYPYTFTAIDVDQDVVYYLVDWGDNTTDQLVGPYQSGEIIVLNHVFSEEGTYMIKAKTRDKYYSESDWAALEVTMPKTGDFVFHQILLRIFEKFFSFLFFSFKL